jgi:HAD superfamily hydrolase (TIGR01509 family)
MIKGIFFDAAGILYSRATPTVEFAMDLLRKGGFAVEIPSEDLAQLTALRVQANHGKVNYTAYWDKFLVLHGVVDTGTRKTFSTQIIDYSNDVIPVPGAREALQGLKQRNFLLGIVTDTMYPLEWKKRRLVRAGVAEYIDVIACSTEVGVHKPDPVMYLNALEQAHLSPEESAFVGHLGIELMGANKAGMTTVAVNFEVEVVADYYCQSILDLLDVPIFAGIPIETNDGS